MTTFKIGAIGGVLITLGMMVARAIEVTPMNFELALGALLTTQLDAIAWVVGFSTHLLISGMIAFVYVAGFRLLRRCNLVIGAGFGIVHWAVSGMLMYYVPRLFSLVPEIMDAPGLAGLHFGPINFAFNLLVHLSYGALVAVLYKRVLAAQAKPAVPAPELKPETKRDEFPRRVA